MKATLLTSELPSGFHPQSLQWPARFEGSSLRPVGPLENEGHFIGTFPGATSTFRTAGRCLIVRHATRGTRRLQATESHLREAGYRISDRVVDCENWLTYLAHSEQGTLHLREQISDGTRSWVSSSAWFWHATLHPHAGPWQATTVITPLNRKGIL